MGGEEDEGMKYGATCIMWVVWREKNKRAFEGVESSSPQSIIHSLILFWCTQKVPYCVDDWVEFLEIQLIV